jgi:2-phospho-L-lactate/phosphoenolpyruvate guanylyltransferase
VRIVAVIPVKPAPQCKQRLSAALDSRARRQLVEIMLDRVVEAVRGVHTLDAVHILTSEQSVVPHGAERIEDASAEVNAGLAAAARLLCERGAEAMLVLPGDIPLVTSADIEGIVALAAPRGMVLVPDSTRSGTNALLLAPPTLVVPRFGPGSLAAHLRAAFEVGTRAVVHECANVARDIDEPRDIAWLLEVSRDSRFDFLRARPAELAG